MNMHPETEDIAAYVEGALPPEERSLLEAHLADCGECRVLAADASLLVREEIRRRRWLAGAPAAALAVAAALVLFVVLPAGEDRTPARDAMRSGSDRGSEALPVVAIVLPDTVSPPHPDSLRFLWRAATPEALYRLVLTDSSGRAVWETTTSDTTAHPPSDLGLAAGRRYFWYVDALLPDGSEASTGVEEFRTRGQ